MHTYEVRPNNAHQPEQTTMPRTAAATNPPTSQEPQIDDDTLGLHLQQFPGWLDDAAATQWWDMIMEHVAWFRVKYQSRRFGSECETPCWTAFYGGFETFCPYEAVPVWLQPLVDAISQQLGGTPFNALLLRLYFDGADEIAWHTDGRTFLGETPTIASLSLGATASFQMRRMLDCWPGSGVDGIDHSCERRDFALSDGDLMVMRGDTQKHWHHRVPKAKGRRSVPLWRWDMS